MKLIKNVHINIKAEQDLSQALKKKLGLDIQKEEISILRKSLDARKKNDLKYNYTLLLAEKPGLNHPDIVDYKKSTADIIPQLNLSNQEPFIIGAGPAGLFAALALVEKGFKPRIYDRGDNIEIRSQKVNNFWETGKLDTESNVQFGEGGAGTFSDGKLTSRTNDFYTNKIYQLLVKFGADPTITYDALPHLGTDKLRSIVIKIRKYLEDKGAKFYWNSKFEDLEIIAGNVKSVTINGNIFNPEILLLAIGNSARDSFFVLDKHIQLTTKPFAVGFRIEHLQEYINTSFYGINAPIEITGPATYRLTAKGKDRGIYSFCMCPGGEIIAGSSEEEGIVTNGMSYHNRANKFANSAIVASVNEKDFGHSISDAIAFQRSIEQKAFSKDLPYHAPTQHSRDFVEGTRKNRSFKTTYRPGVYHTDLGNIFPVEIANALKQGLTSFDKRIKGFIQNGILIGPETRTSSPVRIVRDKETRASISAGNLYPIGEGSGYAGGIISSAVDGYKTCQKFF